MLKFIPKHTATELGGNSFRIIENEIQTMKNLKSFIKMKVSDISGSNADDVVDVI
jgi:hypothetical protein